MKLREIIEQMELYHGSRHDISCFKLSKVGSGIGNQGYGYGIYLSINEFTSIYYASLPSVTNKQAANVHTIGPNDLRELSLNHGNMVFNKIPRSLETAEDLIKYAEECIEMLEEEFSGTDLEIHVINEYKEFIEIIEQHYFGEKVTYKEGVTDGIGYMYNVILNKGKNIEDYDLLSNTTEITSRQKRKIFEALKDKYPDYYEIIKAKKLNTGFDYYTALMREIFKDEFKTSQFLLKAGIDGNIINGGDEVIIFDVNKLEIVNKCKVDIKTRKYIPEIQIHNPKGDIEIDDEGTKTYYKPGTKIVHRVGGPAIEFNNGVKIWVQNDEYHRLDGPACEWIDGTKSYYINDILYTEKKFNKIINELKKK